MSQDLRRMFEEERKHSLRMPQGHEKRFEARLEQSFQTRGSRHYYWIGIAASLLLMISLGVWMGLGPGNPEEGIQQVAVQDSVQSSPAFSLGDLSPDLRKVEQYYTTNINLELANLNISDDNKAIADGFMSRLGELDTEYADLSQELNEVGPNEETISAMIRNFQLRLQLLLKLKETLNELNQSKNETVQNRSA